MHTTFLTAALAVAAGVSALPSPHEKRFNKITVTLPKEVFEATHSEPIPFEDAVAKFKAINATVPQGVPSKSLVTRQLEPECSNPQIRIEWDHTTDQQKQAYINAIHCLMNNPPNGQFPASRSRYEDFVALHQTLTPNVHNNNKFLLWHRYFTWTFEDTLRSDCGFQGAIPWFDETRYAGNFAASSIFSSQWYGSINVGGNCVTDGQFANLACDIGPGPGDQVHCLARNNDDSKTANCNSDYVNQCNAYSDYANMEACAEGGPHAWGHNGIGAVMQDVYASPSDPVFFLHHAFVDRNFRIWQNMDGSRIMNIDGTDHFGNALTLDTVVNVYGFRPDVRIRDILDTKGQTLCYRYDY